MRPCHIAIPWLFTSPLWGCGAPQSSAEYHELRQLTHLEQPVTAVASSAEGLWLGVSDGLLHWSEAGRELLDPGPELDAPITFVHEAGDLLLLHVHGKGLYRRLGTGELEPAEAGLEAPTLGLFNPEARPVALQASSSDEQLWLAAAGGLFRSTDQAQSWSAADLSSAGNFMLLYTDVATRGERVVATAVQPDSILPEDFAGLLHGTVVLSEDGGESWVDRSDGLPSPYVSAAAFDPLGVLHVGTLDQGLFARVAGSWQAVDGGPSDVVGLESTPGGLLVASASRGAWLRAADGSWTAAGQGAIAGLAGSHAVTVDGEILAVEGGGQSPPPPPESANGTVHIALSFHVNYYHSYRGDSPTDDGYGLDIDVIRNSLDWLDAHPEVHADWDSDNAFTTDGWMLEDSPDILERIRERVAAGQDSVRLMSWNNGAMAASTREEFDAAILLAQESNAAAFGSWVPGVQPQECMFSPDHLQWYPELGVDWATLFYAANGFTALREDVHLEGAALYNPFWLSDPDSEARMLTVPAYHHADMMDHGGLRGWAQQIHDTRPGDSLLLIHFDADGETWEQFDKELEAVDGLDFVRFTRLQDYLDTHEPVDEQPLPGDIADGTGDGFQSWAEKSFNHEIYTRIAAARRQVDLAARIAGEDPAVGAAIEAALEPRLLSLATTHFGLAAPVLHEDRVQSATELSELALAQAEDAASLAEATQPVDPGRIEVLNLRNAAGPALVEVQLEAPASAWSPESRVRIEQEGVELPSRLVWSDLAEDPVQIRVELVLEVAPLDRLELDWSLSSDAPPDHHDTAPGPLPELEAPFTTCAGQRHTATLDSEEESLEGPRAARVESWSLDGCAPAAIQREQVRWEGLPGQVIRLSTHLGGEEVVDELEEVALSPLRCAGGATELSWRTHGGQLRSRPARSRVESWNGQAADGWVVLGCADGASLAVAHRVPERSSMAFAVLRNEGGTGLLAPLGTLWGDSPWHDGRRTGGFGLADLVVPVVGSQFRPAAPDWGDETIAYRLLVGEDLDPELLDLFAHPPVARAGAWAE